MQAYKQGVFNYIKEESVNTDVGAELVSARQSNDIVSRKYFSGGLAPDLGIPKVMERARSATSEDRANMKSGNMAMLTVNMISKKDPAMKPLKVIILGAALTLGPYVLWNGGKSIYKELERQRQIEIVERSEFIKTEIGQRGISLVAAFNTIVKSNKTGSYDGMVPMAVASVVTGKDPELFVKAFNTIVKSNQTGSYDGMVPMAVASVVRIDEMLKKLEAPAPEILGNRVFGFTTMVGFDPKAEKDSGDKAMTTGGIDFNAKNMGLDVVRDGSGIEMKFDPAMLAEFQQGDFTGVQGIILRITPIESPLPVLGMGAGAA